MAPLDVDEVVLAGGQIASSKRLAAEDLAAEPGRRGGRGQGRHDAAGGSGDPIVRAVQPEADRPGVGTSSTISRPPGGSARSWLTGVGPAGRIRLRAGRSSR